MCDYCDCRELGPIGELSKQHEEIAAVAFRLRRQITSGDTASTATLEELRRLLAPHLAREERGIFAQLATRGDFGDYLAELLDDHARVTTALLDADPARSDWAPRALLALEELHAHIDVEEHDLFPCSRLVIDDAGWERVEQAHRDVDRAWNEEQVDELAGAPAERALQR